MIVYLITNTVNGKRYVGQTALTLEERWGLHKYRKSCPAMVAAVRKYGSHNFTIEALFDSLTEEQANEFEKEYIERYNTLAPNGYNLTTGGNRRYALAPEVVERLSNFNKGNKNALGAFRSEEYKQKLSNIFKGRVFTDEWRKKMSVSASRRRASDETKLKLSKERKQRGVRPPILTTEELVQAGRISGHKRYHVARNIINPKCLLCREGNNVTNTP